MLGPRLCLQYPILTTSKLTPKTPDPSSAAFVSLKASLKFKKIKAAPCGACATSFEWGTAETFEFSHAA